MAKGRKLVFISWDSESSNYLETLFFPIFKRLSEQCEIEVSTLQFSWADAEEIARIQGLARSSNINYRHFSVYRGPIASLGAFFSLWKQRKVIEKILKTEQFDWIMPRSTMPALLIRILFRKIDQLPSQLIFDADGLPIQERLDFTGLKKGSIMHRLLSSIEHFILHRSDRILTRSHCAIDLHLESYPMLSRDKFFKVINGREASFFIRDENVRQRIRRELGLSSEEILLVHSGSLGAAYNLKPVVQLLEKSEKLKLLLLTRGGEEVINQFPISIRSRVQLIKGNFKEVPSYLSAADIGVALRTSAPSLCGLAPIKIGEYLLNGLPVWLSKGIGDTLQDLGHSEVCCFEEMDIDLVLQWIENLPAGSDKEARELGLVYYAMDQSLESYRRALSC